jgi:hypothetical protein
MLCSFVTTAGLGGICINVIGNFWCGFRICCDGVVVVIVVFIGVLLVRR